MSFCSLWLFTYFGTVSLSVMLACSASKSGNKRLNSRPLKQKKNPDDVSYKMSCSWRRLKVKAAQVCGEATAGSKQTPSHFRSLPEEKGHLWYLLLGQADYLIPMKMSHSSRGQALDQLLNREAAVALFRAGTQSKISIHAVQTSSQKINHLAAGCWYRKTTSLLSNLEQPCIYFSTLVRQSGPPLTRRYCCLFT